MSELLINADFLGQPVWMWLTFVSVVFVLLTLDLGVLNRGNREIGVAKSLKLSAFYITLGLAFGGFVYWQLGEQSAVEYVTGFVVEKSLAMDNVFVIAMIFSFFAIPREFQHRVLFWGVLGVVVLRALMIGFGAALVTNFGWVLYVFAAFLIATGVKMLFSGESETDLSKNPLLKFAKKRLRTTDELHGDNFFVRLTDKASGKPALYITPLFMALVMIEIADVIFAVDSVPAIFAITTDPFIVYTSNIFAILGLRALYFALAAALARFQHLKYALATLLVFIGSKIFVADLLGWEKFPAAWSLGITVGILAAGFAYSLWKTRDGAGGAEVERADA